MKYALIASRVFNTPLFLSPDKAEIIANVFLRRMRGETPEEEFLEGERTEPTTEKAGSIAVISVAGSLVHKASGMEARSGLRTYIDIAADVQSAATDPSIKGIILRCDSPGGEVAGAFDCADAVYRARQSKPVWAIAEDSALSAGYLLASQASRVYSTQTGMVGSIGIIMMHFDLSEADKKEGIVVTTLYRGARKADFSPHAPLSKGAQKWADHHLDTRYEQFVAAVARGRGIDAKTIRDTEAGIFTTPEEAQRIGLVDGGLAFGELVNEFTAALKSGKRISLAAAASATAIPPKESTRMDGQETTTTTAGGAPPVSAPAAAQDAAQMRQQIEALVRGEVIEVNELCALAGKPEMAVEFISKGVKPATVRSELLKLLAQADAATEISSHITADAGAGKNAKKETFKAADLMREKYPNQQKGAN